MDSLGFAIFVYYVAIIGVVCLYGVHRYWLVWTFFRSGRSDPEPGGWTGALPSITVQLPMYNEPYVAERIIEAVCRFDYPPELLQIQVLDDSTDQTVEIARACCERLRASGHRVDYVHRSHRVGYKAGALAHGLETADGEFVAVFDADFVPPPQILRQLLARFTAPDIGMVQARWEHLNRDESLLTRVQAIFLDGHFVVEQSARARSGRWFNFNGTAGLWRRSCIEAAGGWEHDTLTEDTDLSYRAQLEGWRFVFASDIVCPAEIPPTLDAFLTQQHRWNKGLIQTAIKLWPRIARSEAPLATKLEAWFHLTCPIVYVVIFALSLLVLPALLLSTPPAPFSFLSPAALAFLCLLLGTTAACVFYLAAEHAVGRGIRRPLLLLPAVLAIGVGISWINTRAVFEALWGNASPFVRTPKFNGARRAGLDPIVRDDLVPPGLVETAVGVLVAIGLVVVFERPFTLVGAPFLMLFCCGYLATGLPRLAGWIRLRFRPSGQTLVETPAVGPSG